MSKYASLPDLDHSQDVYETPDLADDISTIPTTIGARTTSPAFSDDDRDLPSYRPIPPQLAGHHRQYSTASAAAASDSIDRTRLQPSTARHRYGNTELDASGVDFSDRVGRRKWSGYSASSKKKGRSRGGRRRKFQDSGVFYGSGEMGVGSEGEGDIGGSEDEGEEEEESLEGRLARLRREVEELKVQVDEREEREKRAREEKRKARATTTAEQEGVESTEDGKEGEDAQSAPLPISEVEPVDTEGETDDDAEADGIDGKRLRTGITQLSDALEMLQSSSTQPTRSLTRHGRAEANLTRKIASSLSTVAATQESTEGPKEIPTTDTVTTAPLQQEQQQPNYTVTYAPTFRTSHSLARAADFDLRLTYLERLLGSTSSYLSSLDKHLPANAIIPTLDDLARQISVLTSTNQPFVEALYRRVKALTEQAEKLTDAKRNTAKATMLEGATTAATTSAPSAFVGGVGRRATVSTALSGPGDADPVTSSGAGMGHIYSSAASTDADREAKINALYGVLPTIQQLGPILPSVLDRLRSLRAIHSDAGRAAEGLEGVEKRQEEMSMEIAKWRGALEKVEGVMKNTEGVFMGNVGKVEEWMKDLEVRMENVEKLAGEDGNE